MAVSVAQLIVGAAMVYLAVGLVFAVAFALKGAGKIDPNAVGGSNGFRVLIVPGAAALWPYLLMRWMRAAEPPVERTPHRRAASDRTAAST